MFTRFRVALVAALALLCAAPARAQIYTLPAASAVNSADFLWVDQGTSPVVSRKITVLQLSTFINGLQGTATGYNVGTFGSTLCLLTSACTWASGQVISLSDDGSAGGPNFYLTRVSVSPAASDILGQLVWNGRDTAGATTTYGVVRMSIIDPTDGTETALMGLRTIVSGALSTRLYIGSGVYLAGASGGDMGSGTLNAGAYYLNGTSLFARGNAWTADNSFAGKVTMTGHVITTTGATPGSPTGCGAGGTVAGSDNAFRVSVGTGGAAGSCVVTFATAWTSIPICQGNDNTSGAAVPLNPSLTTVTIGGTIPAGDKVAVFCQG